MDDAELQRLVEAPESDRVERKASLSGERVREAIKHNICAFANDLADNRKPGVIVIGLRDDGTCADTPITDTLLTSLAGIRSDGSIQPFPSMDVQRRRVGECEVAAVVVHPSASPPVRHDGRVWIRVGPTCQLATQADEQRLNEKRRWQSLPFDLRPIPSATLDDLDHDLFQNVYLPSAVAAEVLALNHRTIVERLTALRLVDLSGPPTVVGILALAKDPRRFLPGAYIQFIRFDGTDLVDPIISQSEIDGPLSQAMTRLDDLLTANIRTALSVGSTRHQTQPEYPLEALRQLCRNAVMHRSYEGTNAPVRISWFSDRIEILNPGGPYGQVTAENFGTPGLVDYRNPHVAEALKALGFVERFGIGIALARKELDRNGNPPLEIETSSTHVLVRLRRRGAP
jgi:ATP-dependent DNA helicase RecG